MLFEDRQRAESFGGDADRYNRVRPRYPDELVQTLLADTSGDVLDVGTGTGIAGSQFAAAATGGRSVLGVEPDERMAALARARGLDVEIGHFERWDPSGRRFGLLVSGQAWHWVDPVVGAEKAASVLTDDGRIGVFWNFVRPSRELHTALLVAYDAHEPALARTTHMLGNADERRDAIADGLARTGRFAPAQRREWHWTRSYTSTEWQDQLATHSDHRQLPDDRRAALLAAVGEAIDALGGAIEMPYETQLVTARRA